MTLRKEQGLLIAVAALLAILVATGGGREVGWRRTKPKAHRYEGVGLPPAVIVDGRQPDVAKLRSLSDRPSRTTPLPPPDWPELALPPFPELPLVEPPLDAGPSLRYWYLRRVDPARLKVTLAAEQKPAGEQGSVPDGGQQGPTEGEADDESWARSYDRIDLADGKHYWGRVLGSDRYGHGQLDHDVRLRVLAPFQSEVPFQSIDPKRGTVTFERFAFKPDQIASLTFADNIQNRIAMARRRIPPGDTGLRDRERFVHELLTAEREHPEALAQAETQAREYIAAAPAVARGWELLTQVFATTGQLEKELATYEELGKSRFKSHAFVARGLGVLEQRLGLFEDAEAHLRDAVRLDTTGARNHDALSRFLYERGRAREAVAEAREARRLVVPGMSPHEAYRILTQAARALLGVGDNDEARTALTEAQTVAVQAELGHLDGCVSYAKGRYDEARAKFEAAAAAMPLSSMPLVGAGLAAFHLGDHDAALARFEAAAERDPLERHVALAGQAFLYLLAPGRIADAVARCEEAQRLAPRDPYVLYLLGRAYRESGRFEEAAKVLDDCLRDHHDFVEAMAELAWTRLIEARQAGGESFFDLLESADRLAARAVAEEATRGKAPIYQDLLGVIRYHRGQNESARRAFEASEKSGGGLHPKIWLALLRSRLGHVDDAIARLRQVWQFIRDEKDPYKVYADKTRRLLTYHRGKRRLADGFTTLARHWDEHKQGQRRISWHVTGGKLRVRGTPTREGATFMRYQVERAKDFVEAEIDLGIGATNTAGVVLRISDERKMGGGNAQSTLEVRAGYNFDDGWIYARTQRQENDKTTTKLRAEDRDDLRIRPDEPVKIRVERFMGIDGAARKGAVIVSWNGTEIVRRQLSLSAGNRPLLIDLRVDCEIGQKVDAWFDDFRLVTIGAE